MLTRARHVVLVSEVGCVIVGQAYIDSEVKKKKKSEQAQTKQNVFGLKLGHSL